MPETAGRLRSDATDAAAVRAWHNHPDVVALRVERVRRQIDVLTWVGIGLGLSFTMVNVQTFAAAGAAEGSLPWLAAWLLDPMVSLVLIAVLRAEQVTARYQVDGGPWVRRTKWFTFTATYVMNTWSSWAAAKPSSIFLHSVPPALVFTVAEIAPVLRDRLTVAVNRAATNTAFVNAVPTAAELPVHEPSMVNTTERPAMNASTTAPVNGKRKKFHDFLAEARAAHTSGVEVTPAWVREHVDCSRGSSQKVADALREELTSTELAA